MTIILENVNPQGEAVPYLLFMKQNGIARTRAFALLNSPKAPPVFRIGRTWMIDRGIGQGYMTALAEKRIELTADDLKAAPTAA